MRIWFFIVVSCLIVYLVLMRTAADEVNSVELYDDNGRRMLIALDLSEWEKVRDRERQECTHQTLVKCRTGEAMDCFSCNQVLASCVHFDTDETVEIEGSAVTIPRNETTDEGYCLRLVDKNKRTCTRKNGGQWILRQSDGGYAYVCHCSRPAVFDNEAVYGDCNVFHGCRGGSIRGEWSSIDNIECDCPSGYVFKRVDDLHPTCVKKNIFQFDQHDASTILPPQYVDPGYRGAGMSLPNPCTFDINTNEHNPLAGRVVFDERVRVAYCEAMDTHYTAITMDDDYLVGNGGKYPNAIVRFLEPTKSVHAIVYETHTKRRDKTLYPWLRAVEITLGDFLYRDKFPQLSELSYNGGSKSHTAPYYKWAMLGVTSNSRLYVFSPPTPTQPQWSPGTYLTFIPTYVWHVEATRKHFVGNVPFKYADLARVEQHFIISVSKGFFKDRYPQFGMEGYFLVDDRAEAIQSTHRLLEKYIAPLFNVLDENNNIVPNPYTSVFTGLYRSLYVNGRGWETSIVSPGARTLVDLYRRQFDEAWVPLKISRWTILDHDFTMATNDECAGRSATQYDCDDIANPKEYTKFTCSELGFKWSGSY